MPGEPGQLRLGRGDHFANRSLLFITPLKRLTLDELDVLLGRNRTSLLDLGRPLERAEPLYVSILLGQVRPGFRDGCIVHGAVLGQELVRFDFRLPKRKKRDL